MFRVPLVTSDQPISLDQFWTAVLIYHDRPHLINRRLIGVCQAFFVKVDFFNSSIKKITELLTHSALLYEIRKLKKISKDYIKPDLIKSILEPYDKECILEESSVENFRRYDDGGIYVSVRILLPRQSNIKKCVEVVVFYKNENQNIATFFAVTERDENSAAPSFPYDIEFLPPGYVNICVENVEYAETSSADWLVSVLFHKLMKWAEEMEFKPDLKGSLSLVNIDLYSDLYHKLKGKYGKEIVKIWPENTDPYKFVYEDVAIASYLIALWQKDGTITKPSFVDLGCGNGLLVHILNQEGYPGYGIDVRKRKIWDLYPKDTILKVETINPMEISFPETDWIIGNHSDELTPWIPVITSKSSYSTNFFLLPCCSYEFSGKKYQRKNTSKSQYQDYIDYVEDICKTCGFVFAKDKLRIPSTKRICLVSKNCVYAPKDHPTILDRITELLKDRMSLSEAADKTHWKENFVSRSKTESVRNCTKLNRDVVRSILEQISNVLLSESNVLIKSNGDKWNRGKKESLPELVKCIKREDLLELKKECGGLQTLLKNHRYLFQIENGLVQFRIPPPYDRNNSKHKSKSCWFRENHPDGCYYNDEDCSYRH